MVKKILTGADFVEGVTFTELQFIRPPRQTYAVWLDSFTRRGADGLNLLKEHNYTIELYSEFPDPDAEERIEEQFDLFGIEYEKEDRYFILGESLYQVVYTFSFIEK